MKLFKGSTEIKSVFKNLMISVSDIFDAPTTSDKVLVDEVFYNNDGRQVGTMPDNGSVSKSLSLGETFIIPKGYHPGTGRVTSSYIKLQTFYTGDSEPSADLGVVGDLYFMTGSQSGSGGGSVVEPTPTLISFTIAGTSYQAEEGMTWGEWVASSYNTAEYIIMYGNQVYDKSAKNVVCDTGGNSVNTSQTITSGYAYKHY